MRFLESLSDALLERSPEELIAALLIAALIAIAMAGIYALGRRNSIASPSFVGGLVLCANALCMALAAGYIEHGKANWNSGSAGNNPSPANWPPGHPGGRRRSRFGAFPELAGRRDSTSSSRPMRIAMGGSPPRRSPVWCERPTPTATARSTSTTSTGRSAVESSLRSCGIAAPLPGSTSAGASTGRRRRVRGSPTASGDPRTSKKHGD